MSSITFNIITNKQGFVEFENMGPMTQEIDRATTNARLAAKLTVSAQRAGNLARASQARQAFRKWSAISIGIPMA